MAVHRPKPNKALQVATKELFRTQLISVRSLYKSFPFIVSGAVLDPSAGDGRWITELRKQGNKNNHAIYDIRKSELKAWKKAKLIKRLGRANCKIVKNWLDVPPPALVFDNMITNPPFSLAREFVQRGFEWVKPGGFVSILHRLNWLGTVKRSQWLHKSELKYVIVFANRIKFELDGREDNKADTYEYAIYVFQQGYDNSKRGPRVRWVFNQPD